MTNLKHNWTKHGIIWKPLKISEETYSHATGPTPIELKDGVIRVFYTSRDSKGIGRVFWVDVDSANPRTIKSFSKKPVLNIGQPGMFDDNGVMACSVVRAPSGELYMYYAGFEICEKIRYRILTGLAISKDNGETFFRYSECPVLERADEENYFRCGAHVTYENGTFRMWYIAGSSWIQLQGVMYPKYNMRYLESADGVTWPQSGSVVLETDETVHGYGRPWLLTDINGNSDLFYSARDIKTSKYSIGLARKSREFGWHRVDSESGFSVGESSFTKDSLMFASFARHENRVYCFYNGDQFGEEGFAFAEEQID